MAKETPEMKVQQKLSDLAERAKAIKADPNLRHSPNEYDIRKASENANLMQSQQFKTIKGESGEN